jgi:magnesium-transporting ATPase (P-type)
LLAFAGKVGGDHAARRLDAIPFDSRHRFMAVLTEGPAGRLIQKGLRAA